MAYDAGNDDEDIVSCVVGFFSNSTSALKCVSTSCQVDVSYVDDSSPCVFIDGAISPVGSPVEIGNVYHLGEPHPLLRRHLSLTGEVFWLFLISSI